MDTGEIDSKRLASSVIAVPPLARRRDLEIDERENRRLLAHLERCGVGTVLYGGNANLYNVSLREYERLIAELPGWVAPGTWVVPSFGPSFGTMLDHVDVLRHFPYPTAMALPLEFPSTPGGVATGLRRAAERYGRPIVVYVKSERYLTPQLIAELFDDGLVSWIKYAIVRPDPNDDVFLSRLTDLVSPRAIVSGMGERPAPVHARRFGLVSFTSGSVCVAPRHSRALLDALRGGRWEDALHVRERMLPLEDLRDAISPIRVLHDAVTAAGIADMGPMSPMLSNLEPDALERVGAVARELAEADAALEFAAP